MATREDVLGILEAMKDRLEDPGYRERLGAFTKTMQFDCTDLETSFVMRIVDGDVTALEESRLDNPDIGLTMDSDTFVGIATGEINAMSAFMSGRISAKAALPDLLKLQQLLQ